ncbi:MAG: UPF0280 family protein [Armatimonadia bacterium]|nr:UPF0280 family protein [Armatimonadia bacterium]
MSPHEPRRYRKRVAAEGLVRFEVAVAETDLMVLAERELRDEARAAAREARRQIQSHGALRPEFLSARRPLPVEEPAPDIVFAMYGAGRAAGTGPMAAVAGAVAEHVARALSELSSEVIVENGGDLFLITQRERLVAVSAPGSPMDGRMALVVPPGERGICTSSGTLGHSASAGRADAVVIAAPKGAVADAVATAAANRVTSPDDIQAAVDFARGTAELEHVLIICGDALGTWGTFEMTETRKSPEDRRSV